MPLQAHQSVSLGPPADSMQVQVWEPVLFGPLLIVDKLQGSRAAVSSHAANQGNVKPKPDLRAFIFEVQFCLENQKNRLAVGSEVRRKA